MCISHTTKTSRLRNTKIMSDLWAYCYHISVSVQSETVVGLLFSIQLNNEVIY